MNFISSMHIYYTTQTFYLSCKMLKSIPGSQHTTNKLYTWSSAYNKQVIYLVVSIQQTSYIPGRQHTTNKLYTRSSAYNKQVIYQIVSIQQTSYIPGRQHTTNKLYTWSSAYNKQVIYLVVSIQQTSYIPGRQHTTNKLYTRSSAYNKQVIYLVNNWLAKYIVSIAKVVLFIFYCKISISDKSLRVEYEGVSCRGVTWPHLRATIC